MQGHARPDRAVSGAQEMPAGSGMVWQLLRAGGSLPFTRGPGLPARAARCRGVGGRVLATGEGAGWGWQRGQREEPLGVRSQL